MYFEKFEVKPILNFSLLIICLILYIKSILKWNKLDISLVVGSDNIGIYLT